MSLKRLFSLSVLAFIVSAGSASVAEQLTASEVAANIKQRLNTQKVTGSVEQYPSAQKVVGDVTNNVLKVFRNDKEKIATDKRYLKEKVNELVVPYLDFKSMSILILSKKRWKAASEAEQAEFVNEFKELLTNTYAQSLSRFSEETIDLLPFEPHPKRPEKLAVVKSQVKLGSGTDIPLNYKLRYQADDGWKVYDIYVEGVSIVTSYRGSFASTLATQGLAGLITQIKARNDKYKS